MRSAAGSAMMGTVAALTHSCSLRLATQLEALPELLAGASAGDLERRPAPGKWTARENLAHLGRYHEVFLERIRRILSEDRPALPRYRAEDDPEWARWSALPVEEVLKRLSVLRSELVDRIRHLSPEELDRTGVHAGMGELAIPHWVEFFLLHEAHHLYAVMPLVRRKDADGLPAPGPDAAGPVEGPPAGG